MIKNISIKLTAILAVGLIAFVMGAFAQSAVTGAINGKVTDPQGSVVPNATIVVTNIATNQSVNVNASDDGTYKVTNLQPGTYTVATTVSGFAPARAEKIIVEVGYSADGRLAKRTGRCDGRSSGCKYERQCQCD